MDYWIQLFNYARAVTAGLPAPDIALAHVRSELTGDERSPGETFEYRKSALFTRKAGSWRIRGLHNTRIRPNAIAASSQ
jgi:hypothetical protein